MAEFKEVMKHWKRMCEGECFKCPLGALEDCLVFIKSKPQRAEEIIIKWAEEHPMQTNEDKFKEIFGIEIGIPEGCFGTKCPYPADTDTECKECRYYNFWQQEYKEPKGE